MARPARDNAQFTGSGLPNQAEFQRDDEEPRPLRPAAASGSSKSAVFSNRQRISAKLANPLAGKTYAELEDMGTRYAKQHQLGDEEDIRAFQKGACLAQDPQKFNDVDGLTGQELDVLQKEFSSRWSQPRLLYLVIVLCSACAAVQGMGE